MEEIKTTSQTTHDGKSQGQQHRRLGDLRFALVGGGIGAASMFFGVAIVGSVGFHEARTLLQSVKPPLQFLSSGTLTAGATVLALMLTLLGITFSIDMNFSGAHFERIKIVSKLATVTIVLSIVLLLVLLLPVADKEGSTLYNNIVYYTLIAGGSGLGGISAAVALMLHRTIGGMAEIGHPGTDTVNSELLADIGRGSEPSPPSPANV